MLLEVRDVDTFYGDSQVLNGAAFAVAPGQQVGILGRNGMGKTTLVHTIMGFLRPRQGEILFDGHRISGSAPEKIARRGVTLVPQGRRVFGSLTVGETLQIAYRKRGAQPWTVKEVCERLPILGDRWNQQAGLMSGGQRQMLALGRALVGNGQLVLMDEPSEGLDQHHLAMVVETVHELRRRGTAVVVVEQKLRFVLDLVDSVHIMVRGQFVESFSSADVRGDPAPVLRALGFTGRDAVATIRPS
ncbi:ABC transporter ATP-binding protein [Blastococcus sp. CT_GayMR20]|uniref:ABC transporter ATP-binding protein n=1 Tax=Blastococcus sp. CT_GayMR20 TaxID=2559609 RepID=UPI0010744A79|nr:ABC transporter ATP-binding protein [Blastococcus sp. CT_GayMR20]TFV83101.1 ABC transporter ATP-binding protein [Blastococcus sp. CT_GayMR20]